MLSNPLLSYFPSNNSSKLLLKSANDNPHRNFLTCYLSPADISRFMCVFWLTFMSMAFIRNAFIYYKLFGIKNVRVHCKCDSATLPVCGACESCGPPSKNFAQVNHSEMEQEGRAWRGRGVDSFRRTMAMYRTGGYVFLFGIRKCREINGIAQNLWAL